MSKQGKQSKKDLVPKYRPYLSEAALRLISKLLTKELEVLNATVATGAESLEHATVVKEAYYAVGKTLLGVTLDPNKPAAGYSATHIPSGTAIADALALTTEELSDAAKIDAMTPEQRDKFFAYMTADLLTIPDANLGTRGVVDVTEEGEIDAIVIRAEDTVITPTLLEVVASRKDDGKPTHSRSTDSFATDITTADITKEDI